MFVEIKAKIKSSEEGSRRSIIVRADAVVESGLRIGTFFSTDPILDPILWAWKSTDPIRDPILQF